MTLVTDDFAGTVLDAAWTSMFDTPTVNEVLTYPTDLGSGVAYIVRDEVLSGGIIVASVNIDCGGASSGVIDLSLQVLECFYDASGAIAVGIGVDIITEVAPTGLTGIHTLWLVMSPTLCYTFLTTEADPTTSLAGAAIASESTVISALATGVQPGIVMTPSTIEVDDFSAGSDVTPPIGPGVVDPPPFTYNSGLVFSITTLRYPEVEPVRVARLTQFTDGEVEIPLNDLRLARVTLSVYDPAVLEVLPLERFLHVRYRGEVVFWGPIVTPNWDLANGTVTINAVDPALRIQKHFVREGDDILIGDDGVATVDGLGLRSLRNCGLNTTEQTDRGVPELGIGDGEDDTTPSLLHAFEVKRGDQVWSTMMSIVGQVDGPDLEMAPQEMDEGHYVLMNTVVRQGTDKSNFLKFHYGWGVDNLESCSVTPDGSVVITHSHVLSQDLKHRGTAAAEGPSARFGPYVYWDALDVNPKSSLTDDEQDAVLAKFGEGKVRAYGEPPFFFTMTPRIDPNGGAQYSYLDDYVVGDTCFVSAKKGYAQFIIPARITKVTLKQVESVASSVIPELEAVPRILAEDDTSSSET